uniref:Uncharacterized protein n=1 Tax=Glossina brevipalpis TaxID=37001 RepID=A0A1A9WQ88_9MUSC
MCLFMSKSEISIFFTTPIILCSSLFEAIMVVNWGTAEPRMTYYQKFPVRQRRRKKPLLCLL